MKKIYLTLVLSFAAVIAKTQALPVDLFAFTGIQVENTIELRWTTKSEINNQSFTVESSTDGINFKTVDMVDGAGTSNLAHSYSITDNEPATGLSYYRLKQTDFDGEETSLQTLAVEFKPEGVKLSVYPNPAENYFIITAPGEQDESVNFTLYDMNGRAINNWMLAGLTENKIERGNILPGYYFYTVTNEQETRISTGTLTIR